MVKQSSIQVGVLRANGIVLLCAIVLFFSATSFVYSADAFTLKSTGKRIRGTIVEAGKDTIRIKPRTGAELKFPINDIEEISWDGDPKSFGHAQFKEKQKKWDEAIAGYKKALVEVKSSKNILKKEMQFCIVRLEANRALEDPARRKIAIDQLTKFNRANSNFYRYYDGLMLQGRLLMAENDFEKAKVVFEELDKVPFTEIKMASQSAQAEILFSQKSYNLALSKYQTVIDMPADSAASKTQHWGAKIGKASCLEMLKKYPEMLTILNDVLDNISPSESGLLSEAYLKKGDCLVLLNKPQEAVLAYLVIDIIFPEEAVHPESLNNLVKLWPMLNHPERAVEAKEKLIKKYPKSRWVILDRKVN